MQNYEKKRIRQIRYIEKKKKDGFYYLQTWVHAEKLIGKKLQSILSKLSNEAIKQLIEQYSEKPVCQTTGNYANNDEKIKYSNNCTEILDAIEKEMKKNHKISQSKLSEILYEKYNLCSFSRTSKQPIKIKPGNLSKYTKKLRLHR